MRRRIGGVLQQRQMQPLQAAVLLRLAGRNALGHGPGLDHFDGKLRQPAGAARGKWRPIVRAQPQRQAEFAECRIKHRPNMLRIGARQCLTAQQVAAMGIAQRQRLTTRTIAGAKPAFEVDAPRVIGCRAWRKRRARRRAASAQPAFDRQPLAINRSPIVLAVGQRVRGRWFSSQPSTFTGPQVGCARRTATHCSAIRSGIACG